MLFPLPGDPAEVAAENTPPGTGIGDRHFLPALAAQEGPGYFHQGIIPEALSVKPLTRGVSDHLSFIEQNHKYIKRPHKKQPFYVSDLKE